MTPGPAIDHTPQGIAVLYSFRRCPYAMRARLAILVSGVTCEIREVALKSKPTEMLAASPKGTVPVLILPCGQVIDESLEIMRWALAHNDPQHWLEPQTETPRAALALISENDVFFKPHLDRYKYSNRYCTEHADTEVMFALAHRAAASNWLFRLESRLQCSEWMSGASASLADMAIGPFVRQFARTDAHWFSAQPWPHLKVWLTRWELCDGVQKMMENYPAWKAGLPPVVWHHP